MARILSTVVAHPFRKVCGATNAAVALSEATAALTPLKLAMMWDVAESFQQGPLRVQRFACGSALGPAARFLPRPAQIALTTSRIPQMIRTRPYDLVHIHNLFPLIAAQRIVRACERRAVPFVISTHGFFELSRYGAVQRFGAVKATAARWLIERPFRRMLAKASAFFCLSPADRDLLAELGVGHIPTYLVTNGVNEFFLRPPTTPELSEVRRRFQLDAVGVPTLLFMGSVHAYKGIDVFLESLTRLRGPWRAVVAGGFRHRDEPHRLMTAAGLSEAARARVTFTGRISAADLRALHRVADLFVYPTRADTLPLVVLEAMAGHLPVVSTTVGGIGFQVTPDCGLLTPPDDPAATAAAVQALLADPQRRSAMGAAARERVERTFRWSAAARCAVDGYREVLAHGRAVDARTMAADVLADLPQTVS